ncbi:hypothetical protein J5690_04305 [bacterium]|nr:hypothetical protein [bacterium]
MEKTLENIFYKEETAKRGGVIGFLKKHYMLAAFMLVSVLISALWYFAPANTDHSIASYYSNAVQPIFAVSILLFLVFLVIKILLEIPKIIKQISKKFGKYSADKSGFWRKIRDIVFYSHISFFLFILIATGIIFGIAALLEPRISPHFPMIFGSDFVENSLLIEFVAVSAIGLLYIFVRFPGILLFLIAAAITLILLLIIIAVGATLSPIAVLAWAVFFSMMRPNRSE